MAKSPAGQLIINEWDKGISPHPDVGFGMFSNVDVYTNPGSVRLNNLPAKVSGSTVTGRIVGFVRNPQLTADIWAYDTGAVVYKSADNGATWAVVAGNSTGIGTGIAIWKDYLFVATTTKLDVYGPLSSSPAWSLAWQTLEFNTSQDSPFHTMLSSVDDKLYICNSRYVAQLKELTTFAPGTGATYTYTSRAITLAFQYTTTCLADLGPYLMVGTWVAAIGNFKVADIFPYARIDLSLGIPLKLNKNGVNCMLSLNNRLYVQAGLQGELFVCDTVTFAQLQKIPNYVANLDGGKYIFSLPHGIMFHQDRIFLGLSTNSLASGVGGFGNMGIYSIDVNNPNKTLVLENIISTGNDGTTNALIPSALLSLSKDTYLSGWQDSTTFGIDLTNNKQRYLSGYIDTPLYPVGEALANRTVQQIEVYLQKPLKKGQGITVSYRTNLTASFTTPGNGVIDYDTYNASSNLLAINISAAFITNAVFVQFRIYLTTATYTATGTATSTINVTALSIDANLLTIGQAVTGTNVVAGSTVASIVSTTAFTLSTATTGAIGTLTFYPPSPELHHIMLKESN